MCCHQNWAAEVENGPLREKIGRRPGGKNNFWFLYGVFAGTLHVFIQSVSYYFTMCEKKNMYVDVCLDGLLLRYYPAKNKNF